jgi:hypothetical protein
MKLARWLSPVRTVEAETGWPRAFCQRFLRHGRATWYWRGLMFGGTFLVLAIVVPVSWKLLNARQEVSAQTSNAAEVALDALYSLPTPLVMFGMLWALTQTVGASAARRFLRRYLPEPWCFKCKYPIPPPREGRSYSNCPECGEPIPPEIASLAAAE